MRRLLAISDIHGYYDMFIDLCEKVQLPPDEAVVISSKDEAE